MPHSTLSAQVLPCVDLYIWHGPGAHPAFAAMGVWPQGMDHGWMGQGAVSVSPDRLSLMLQDSSCSLQGTGRSVPFGHPPLHPPGLASYGLGHSEASELGLVTELAPGLESLPCTQMAEAGDGKGSSTLTPGPGLAGGEEVHAACPGCPWPGCLSEPCCPWCP